MEKPSHPSFERFGVGPCRKKRHKNFLVTYSLNKGIKKFKQKGYDAAKGDDCPQNITTTIMATSANDAPLPQQSFAVATYNVWFGRDGRGSPHPEARMHGVVQALVGESDIPPLVCGLQEVVPELSAVSAFFSRPRVFA